MIKIEETTRKVTTKVYICDVCGKETTRIYNTCVICGRDVCVKCCIEIYDTEDYPAYYCEPCWDIGRKYRQQIEELDVKVSKLYDKWEKEAKEKINKM